MVGGTKPHSRFLKNINLLSGDMEKFLNPLYGFIWANSAIIDNIFISEKKNRNSTAKLVRSTYNNIMGRVQPIQSLFENKFVTNRDIGKYLALKYKYMVEIDDNTKWNKCMETLNSISQRLDKIKKFTGSDLIRDKQKESMIKMINKLSECTGRTTNFTVYNETEFLNIVNELSIIIKNKLTAVNDVGFNDTINIYIDSNWESIKENFYIVLSIMWHKADNKQGIKDYYDGINDVFNNIVIPESFMNEEYDLNEFTFDSVDYYEQLAYLYNEIQGGFEITGQEYAYIHNVAKPINYPDCGASALRTFIRLWLTQPNTNSYDIDKLRRHTTNEKLIEYFTIFNDNNTQISKHKYSIFGQLLNPRDAWVYVVSNLSPDITYKCQCTLNDGSCLNYEIKANIANMKKIFSSLFTNMPDFKAFEFDNSITNDNDYMYIDDFKYTDASENFGAMKIHSGKYGTFIWLFEPGHTYINREIDEEGEEFTNENPELNFYLTIFSTKSFQALVNNKQYYELFPYWYKFFSYKNHDDILILYNEMTNIINDDTTNMKLNHDITLEAYNNIVKLLLFHLKDNPDALSRIYFLNKVSKENLILYFSSMFTVVINADNDIVALKFHETFNNDVWLDNHNFNLLTNLNELDIKQNITINIKDTNNIVKLNVNNFSTIYFIKKTNVKHLYIDNILLKDTTEGEINEMLRIFKNIITLELGPNCDFITDYFNDMNFINFKAYSISGKLNSLPNSVKHIELIKDVRTNWESSINLKNLQTIVIHNNNFINKSYEIKFNLTNNNSLHIISNATKSDISEYLFDMEIENDKIHFSMLHKSYLEDIEQLSSYEEKCELHGEYLHDLLFQIKEFNNISDINIQNVTYSYADMNNVKILLYNNNELYDIDISNDTMIIKNNDKIYTIKNNCKNNYNDKIVNLFCKIVAIKNISVFLPNISMDYTEYQK